MNKEVYQSNVTALLQRADSLHDRIGGSIHDDLVATIYRDAAEISAVAVNREGRRWSDFDQKVDRIVTSRIFGFPIMLALLTVVFWVTIKGANVPSEMLASGLFWLGDKLEFLLNAVHSPWWLTGFLVHGVYRGMAWVVAVMLPPMMIFFPLFTILEDLGYLPRVAFNLDRLFKTAGAHGKQALTMAMGFGCNAAGVTACRIIESPRERLIAILTNNFAPCNGRWPTLILVAGLFVAAPFPPAIAALAAAGSVVGVTLFGVFVMFVVSWVLSRTVLKGEASAFTLELPPYRKPQILKTLYTSLIDRTLLVLWRAVIMAAPAGGVCWLLGNITSGGQSLMAQAAGWLNPFGLALGLDGVILLAYIVAIPANEIIVPTILMAYMNAGMMVEMDSLAQMQALLVSHGWTIMTAVSLMLFSLLHNPCSTTIMAIYNETKSLKWTVIATLMPLALAFAICFAVAQVWRLLSGGL
ncbi:MAG: ferrous iron transporter B [Armatimonadetes bacterium]|nr:ferrous iron transporter B [Armatimonadota bacterium]